MSYQVFEDIADDAGFLLLGDGKLYSPREDFPINDLLERFSELIVRECLSQIEKTISADCTTDAEKMGCEYAITNIKNYFGIDQEANKE